MWPVVRRHLDFCGDGALSQDPACVLRTSGDGVGQQGVGLAEPEGPPG